MRQFDILADASCDITDDLQQKYDIHVIPGHMCLPDHRDVRTYPRWDLFGRDEFYADLKKRPNEYTTSPPNVAEIAQALEESAEKGRDALLLTISGGMSGTYNFALQARNQVLEKHPEMTIHCVDSLRFGPGLGLMTVHAAELRAGGADLGATATWIEDNKNRYHQAGWLDDLSFVAKKGRLTHSKAFFGTLAGVKPIGEFDYNGLTTVIGKVKGAQKAYEVLLTYIAETAENPGEQTFVIAQTNRLPQAETFKRMIEERFHPREVRIQDVYPCCGVNIGPGLMAAYYVGKPISSDLSAERAIIENASRTV